MRQGEKVRYRRLGTIDGVSESTLFQLNVGEWYRCTRPLDILGNDFASNQSRNICHSNPDH